jgi:hypothetical protein
MKPLAARSALRTILLRPEGLVAVFFGCGGLVSTLLFDERTALSVAAHSLSLIGMMACYAAIAGRGRTIPFTFVGLMVALAALQPATVILATWLGGGDVTYTVAYGTRSHHIGAPLVAAVQFASVAAMTLVDLVGRRRDVQTISWRSALAALSGWVHGTMAVAALVYCAARLATLFAPEALDPGVAYVVRLFLGLSVGVFFFVGTLARVRSLVGIAVAAVAVLTSLAALLGGNRGDAILPLLIMAAGFVVAHPTRPARLARWTVVAGAVFAAMLYLGSVIRSDDRGRSGAALAARFDTLGETVSYGVRTESAIETVLLRLLRHSTHAVLTDIPEDVPFEPDGVVKLPSEFVERLLPQWNVSGTADVGSRNWMLNELGFLVNWNTSVELSLVADGWYRDGVWGVLVVSVLAAFALRGLEALISRRLPTRPEYLIVLIFAASGIYLVEGRDVIWGLRTMVFLVLAAELMLLPSRWIRFASGGAARKSHAHG